MGKDCKYKQIFRTKDLADNFAQDYMHRIVITLHPMVSFYCKKHRCYHVGHDRFSNQNKMGVDKFSDPM